MAQLVLRATRAKTSTPGQPRRPARPRPSAPAGARDDSGRRRHRARARCDRARGDGMIAGDHDDRGSRPIGTTRPQPRVRPGRVQQPDQTEEREIDLDLVGLDGLTDPPQAPGRAGQDAEPVVRHRLGGRPDRPRVERPLPAGGMLPRAAGQHLLGSALGERDPSALGPMHRGHAPALRRERQLGDSRPAGRQRAAVAPCLQRRADERHLGGIALELAVGSRADVVVERQDRQQQVCRVAPGAGAREGPLPAGRSRARRTRGCGSRSACRSCRRRCRSPSPASPRRAAGGPARGAPPSAARRAPKRP